MKNLENYSVQALNANEIREVDGGYTLKWWEYISPDLGLGAWLGGTFREYIDAKYNQGCNCH